MRFDHYNFNRTTFGSYMHDVEGNPYVYVSSDTSVNERANKDNFYNVNLYSEYSGSFGEHSVKGMVGFQAELFKNDYLSAWNYGMLVDNLTTLDTTTGLNANGEEVAPTIGGTRSEWATSGFFGRINYDYRGRYLLEVNLRYDGTSRYTRNMRWLWFPSVSLGWNVAREKFWIPLAEKIRMLKLRASYGMLGNQNTSSYYPTYQVMGVDAGAGSWLLNGSRPNIASVPRLVSSLLSWETVETYNIGLDVSALKDRLTASFDYFRRYTNDMIGPAQELPAILGIGVPKYNNTNLVTYGFELQIGWRDRIKDFNYSVNFLLSDSQTEIIRYPNEEFNLSRHYAGKKMGEIWGYTTIGIAKTKEEMDVHLATLPYGGQSALGDKWEAGDIMYRNINGNGRIDEGANTLYDHGALSIIGNNTPRFNFGLDMFMEWKGIDVRIFFQGVIKRDFARDGYYFWGINGSTIWNSTAFVEHLDYFRADSDHPFGQNLDSYYPRPIMDTSKNQKIQTAYLQDASYIRLKNPQIGYTFPSKLTQKGGVEELRFLLPAENLWTGTKLATMFDPETVGGGMGGNVYPLTKTIVLGLSGKSSVRLPRAPVEVAPLKFFIFDPQSVLAAGVIFILVYF